MAKTFNRKPWAAIGLAPATYHAGIADGTIPLTPVKLGPRATGVDDDELLRYQLGLLATARGVTGAGREAWIDAEFIKAKAEAQQVREYRERAERKPRGMHAKRVKLVRA